MMIPWMQEAQANELSVVIVGDLRFLGKLVEGESDWWIENAFPIGTMKGRDPETGVEVSVPALGFLHWCWYEPVRRLDLSQASYTCYHVKDQTPETQKRFETAYNTFVQHCRNKHTQQSSLVASANMNRVDEMARQAGGAGNLVAILKGKEPDRG